MSVSGVLESLERLDRIVKGARTALRRDLSTASLDGDLCDAVGEIQNIRAALLGAPLLIHSSEEGE